MKKAPVLFLLLASILVSSTAFCLHAPGEYPSGKLRLEEKVVEHTLKNGMKLLLVERHSSPTVSSWIRFRVGSVNEKSDERGIAHLLEHMLFKGTKSLGTTDYAQEKPLLDRIEQTAQEILKEKAKNSGKSNDKTTRLEDELARLESEASKFVIKDEFFELYSKNGGVGYNAFTGRDGTTYLINLPSNKLELWGAIESDRMRNAVFREFYTERSVVMEERRRSYEADPGSRLWELFIASSYMVHPYGEPTIGWMSDIENLTRTKAERFFHSYYSPSNAIVAIVGDIDAKKTISMVEKYFGSIPPGVLPSPVTDREPPQGGEKRIELMADAEPSLLIGFHKPAIRDTDDYVFDMISMLLGEGRTSRLYRKLVTEKQIASDISVFTAPGSIYPNLFVISADPRYPHTVREVEEAVLSELERLKTEAVTEREIKQALNMAEFEEIRQMSTNGGLARNLTEYEAVAGTWRYMTEYRKEIAKVTPEDIRRVALGYFKSENRTIGFITKRGVNEK